MSDKQNRLRNGNEPMSSNPGELHVEQIASLASSIYGSNAPEAIAFCGLEAWMNREVDHVHRFANAFRRLRN